jgi:hypothetical protein
MRHCRTVPTPPDAWLVVLGGCVLGAFPTRDDPELQAMLRENHLESSASVLLDHPSVQVLHHSIVPSNPSWLTARDNWFERHRAVLEPHLRDPLTATVYTFTPGKLTDPLVSHKSSKDGPFAFPRGREWPRCGFCNSRLGFLGALDFRKAADRQIPRGSLVLHGCTECGICADREAWTLTWIKQDEEIEILGDASKRILVGTPWEVTEYPLPAPELSAEELAASGLFSEMGFLNNFSCLTDKVGGHVFWIQHEEGRCIDENSFVSDEGEPMTYIGQLGDSPDIEIGDGGIAYLLFSPRTGETIMYPQSG